MSGFRLALTLENGEPADPACSTIIPTWHVGDESAGDERRKFRIVAVERVTER